MATTAQALKGRPPLRACPDDFMIIFIEKGREACEAWYRARKTTVTRWLIESGKEQLIVKRAAYVKSMRSQGKWLTRSSRLFETHRPKPATIRETIRDRRKINPLVARHAAQYLRVIRNGGFIVSQAPNGDWRVGTRLLSAAQMTDLACGKGFDVKLTAEELNPDPAQRLGDYHTRSSRCAQADIDAREKRKALQGPTASGVKAA